MKDYLRKTPDQPAWIKFVIIGLIAAVIGVMGFALNRSRAPDDDLKSLYIDQKYHKQFASAYVTHKRPTWFSGSRGSRGFLPKQLQFQTDGKSVDMYVFDLGADFAQNMMDFNARMREGKLPDGEPILKRENVTDGECGFPYRLRANFLVCFRSSEPVKIDLRIKY